MSGARPRVGIRIDAEGADEARRKVEGFGRAGKEALDRLNTAAAASSPALQGAARAADIASRSFFAMGGSLGALGNTFTAVASVGTGLTATFAAVAAGAGAAAVAIARAGDAANATLARLGAATGSADSARDVYQQLFALSQQTGIAVGDSAAAFTRFRVAAGEIGATNAQVLKLVEGLQKAAIVGGTSGSEAAAAMQQLGQALASGVLQGDELRSLLENMPQFAQALAREMGVTIGQMRELGARGELVAERVFMAGVRASERMNQEFERLAPTMARAFDILGAAMSNFVARLDHAVGLSEKVAAAAMLAARAVNAVTPASPLEAAEARYSRAQAAMAASGQSPFDVNRAAGLRGLTVGQVQGGLQSELVAAGRAVFEERSAYADLQVAEAERAAAQQTEAARARSAKEIDEFIKKYDKATQAAKDLKKANDEIARAVSSGYISQARGAELSALAQKEYQDQLDKTKDKVKEQKAAAAEMADAHVKAWEKAQDAAQKAAEKAAEAAAREAERFRESSLNAVARTLENAADRLGDALVNAFVSGSGAAVNFGNIARGIVASLASDFVKLALINPIRNAVFSGATAAPTLGGAGFGDLGSIFNLTGLIPKDGILSSLGLSGPGGLLSTQIISPGFGGQVVAGGTEILGGASGATFGGLLGGLGLGFGAGSLLNSLIGGNQLGGTVGSGLGAGAGALIGSVVPGVGTLIGGLIGGLAGGGFGGLFGPKESVRGYGYRVTGIGAGGLAPLDYTYFNEVGAQQFREAEQAIAAINQYVQQRGLTIGGSYIVGGNKNGPDYSWADSGSFNEAFSKLFFGSANDNRLNAALEGRKFGDPGALQSFTEQYFAIRDLTETPAQRLARQLEEVNRQFDELTAKAREYGFAESDLAMARQRAIDQISGADRATARGLLANLTFGGASALAPEQQYFAALSTLNVARRDLAAGGSLAEYAATAQAVLPVARQFLGTSTRYAQLAAEVAQTVAAQGGDPAGLANLLGGVATGTSALEATFASYGERSLSVQSATLAEIRRLADTLTALIARQRAA